jgi:GAF domain-containing protein
MQRNESNGVKVKEDNFLNPVHYEVVLRGIVHRVLSLLDAEHCSIALIDKKTGELVTRASSRVTTTEQLRKSRFKLREGIAGHVAATGQSFLTGDAKRSGQYLRIGDDQIASVMCAPLIHNSQVLGTITVTSPRFDAFTTEHLRLLEEMCDQEAVGIAQLYHADASLRQTQRLTRILQLNQITSNATSREAIVAKILEWLGEHLKSTDSAVILFGKNKNARSHQKLCKGKRERRIEKVGLPNYIKSSLLAAD